VLPGCRGRAEVERRRYTSVYGYETMKYDLMGSTENYTELCTIEVDLSHLPLLPRSNVSGETFYRLSFDTVLLFGLTELEAVVAWKENVRPLLVLLIAPILFTQHCQGVERRSVAKIVYDPDPVNDD
jgi:hypothetical protein